MGYLIGLSIGICFIGLGLRISTAFLSVFGENIILFDSVLFGILSWAIGAQRFQLHSAMAFLTGLFVFVLFYFLQQTTIGFYVIGLIMSLSWGFFFALMAFIFTEDMLWTMIAWVLGTVMVMGLHWTARHQTGVD